VTRDIQVLLSSYNGAPFITAQLASLRAQTAAPRMKVLVRDDGSSDGSVELVRDFEPGDMAVDVVQGRNVGVRASFLALMKAADDNCRYFFLCDQDDVWDADKVAVAVTALEGFADDDLPALYCGRSVVTHADLMPIGPTDDAPRGPSFRNALVQNIAPGHTMAMNVALLRLARQTMEPDKIMMHDCWLYLLATGLGTVIFDSAPHARYRLHGDNDTKYQVNGPRRALLALRRLLTDDRAQWTSQARLFSQVAGASLQPADHAAMVAFLDQSTCARRVNFLRAFGLTYQRGRPIAASLLFLVGRYRDDRRRVVVAESGCLAG